jgi:hypothetical protein
MYFIYYYLFLKALILCLLRFKMLLNIFYPQAIRLLNNSSNGHLHYVHLPLPHPLFLHGCYMVSMCLMPLNLLHSSQYYEPSSLQQPTLIYMYHVSSLSLLFSIKTIPNTINYTTSTYIIPSQFI